jgi:hypothetical protein
LLLALSPAGFAVAEPAPGARAASFASQLTPEVARRLAHEMSPMGALAAGLTPAANTDNAAMPPDGSRALPTASQVIGGTDIDLSSITGTVGTQSDPSIAANAPVPYYRVGFGNGLVLTAVYNDWNKLPAGTITPGHTAFSLTGIAQSSDGGASWGGNLVLPYDNGGGEVYGDPVVKYDPIHDVFICCAIYKRPGDGAQDIGIWVSSGAPEYGFSQPIQVGYVSGSVDDKPSIDINPKSGRLVVSWTSFSSAGISSILAQYSDDDGTTWGGPSLEAPVVIATGSASLGVQGSVPCILPNDPNVSPDNYAYVAYSVTSATTRNIALAVSVDGGATWGSGSNIGADFTDEDQILGVDHVNSWPSMAIDYAARQVYLVYQRNDAQGQGDIVVQTVTGTAPSSPPVLLDSNPGSDRAQFMPWVAVDRVNGRVHVIWYDQGHDASGDVTELMHTYSADHGATWSAPTPLFDRPFHAGYGNDTSEHNFGD